MFETVFVIAPRFCCHRCALGSSFFTYFSHTCRRSRSSICRSTLAGTPAAILLGGDVPRDHRTGGDDAPRPDGHAAAHRHAGGKPAVVPDGDGRGVLQLMMAVRIVRKCPLLRGKGMVGRSQRHIGADQHIVPHRNGRHVQKHTFVVDKAALPHMDVHAVFAVKRRKNLEIPAYCGGNQLLQRPLLGLCPPQGGCG